MQYPRKSCQRVRQIVQLSTCSINCVKDEQLKKTHTNKHPLSTALSTALISASVLSKAAVSIR
ncbi:hypothetical protein T06_10111 [Trichinella sp. T6]|nr:hypothetical protein T06_10111 [Trichinella sp. T6]